MKGYRIALLVSMFVIVTSLTLACNPKESAIQSLQNVNNVSQNQDLVPSAIEPSFPVPKKAIKTNHKTNNKQIKYVRYAFRGLNDWRYRSEYFTEIEKWGWNERKEEQMGAMHVFEKEKKRMHLTVHHDFFTLFFKPK